VVPQGDDNREGRILTFARRMRGCRGSADLRFPGKAWSMERGHLRRVAQKREGERVEPGEALFVLESDKSAENIEAIDAGNPAPDAPTHPGPGERVTVGQVIAYLTAEGRGPCMRSARGETPLACVFAIPPPEIAAVPTNTTNTRPRRPSRESPPPRPAGPRRPKHGKSRSTGFKARMQRPHSRSRDILAGLPRRSLANAATVEDRHAGKA